MPIPTRAKIGRKVYGFVHPESYPITDSIRIYNGTLTKTFDHMKTDYGQWGDEGMEGLNTVESDCKYHFGSDEMIWFFTKKECKKSLKEAVERDLDDFLESVRDSLKDL